MMIIQSNFNSTRTAWILTALLLLTIITQIFIIGYHDTFLMELYSIEEELAEDFVAIDSFATDTINAAYEYNNNNIDEANNVKNNIIQQQHNNNNIIHQEIITKFDNYSMEPMDILKRAGVDVELGFVPSTTGRLARLAQKKGEDLRQQATLPSIEEIQSMYGNHSYIVGLERCDEYRNLISPKDRIMGPAGMFNSATNLLNRLLKINCVNQERVQYAKDTGKRNAVANSGMLLQAPWGKHNPVSWRLHHEAKVGGKGVQQENFLPIVMIKDPITWMASMCRHPYEARWRHGPQHCPNLVPNRFDRGRKLGVGKMGIKVKFATKHIGNEPIPDNKNKTFVEYDSLLDLWNTWYHQWYNATFPRLMVRFEDLMFHAEETVSKVCTCGGGTMRPKFRYVEDSAKGQTGPHAGSAGFLASLVTYGNSTLRNTDILKDSRDADYARATFDKTLMDTFGYALLPE